MKREAHDMTTDDLQRELDHLADKFNGGRLDPNASKVIVDRMDEVAVELDRRGELLLD